MTWASWEDRYLIAQKTGSITSAYKKFLVSDLGADTGKCGLLLTSPTNFEWSNRAKERSTLSGMFVRQVSDIAEETVEHGAMLNFEFDSKIMGLILWLFFQDGATQVSVAQKTYDVWSSSGCEVWATLGRLLSVNLARSQIMDGVVCSSISIKGSLGSPISVSAQMVGRMMLNTFDWNAQLSVFDTAVGNLPMFKDCIFQLDMNGTTLTPKIDSFELTMKNSVQPRYYGSKWPYEFRLGEFVGSMTVTLPIQDDPYLECWKDSAVNAEKWMTLWLFAYPLGVWTSVATFSMTGVVETVEEIESGGEIMSRIVMKLIKTGANSPMHVVLYDNVNRGIP